MAHVIKTLFSASSRTGGASTPVTTVALTLDAVSVRNIVIHNIPDDVVNEGEAADPSTTSAELAIDGRNSCTDIEDDASGVSSMSKMTATDVDPQGAEKTAERPNDDLETPLVAF